MLDVDNRHSAVVKALERQALVSRLYAEPLIDGPLQSGYTFARKSGNRGLTRVNQPLNKIDRR